MKIWESSESLLGYEDCVPEVVGTREEIVNVGTLPQRAEHIPEPRCKAVGYTPLEWLGHWKKTVGIILNIPAEAYRVEWLRLIKKHMRESA